MDYSLKKAPADYQCGNCGATGLKLWRAEYLTCTPWLLCADCACQDQGKTNTFDEEGLRTCDVGGRTDRVGWYVPAVPLEGNVAGYYDYSSVLPAGVTWWKQLPLRVAAVRQ